VVLYILSPLTEGAVLESAKKILEREGKIVNEWLDKLLPGENEPPANLHKAMRYSVFAGGKRLRPILAVLSFRYCGGSGDTIYPPACALEFIHTYSLIHDDLPSMDNDDLRRGLPTNHIVFGEAMAILAGDALHAAAFELLAIGGDIAVVADVAKAIGTKGLVGGQVFDMEAEGNPQSAEILEKIHLGKTAALLTASLRTGAIIAGADTRKLEAVSIFGQKMGLAFQIIDDILDITADEKALGKPIGSDRERGKATYPAFYGIEKSREIATDLIDEAKAAIGESERTESLRSIADFILERAF